MLKISPEWLAGFWDGEGCFYLGTQKHKNGNVYPKTQVMLSQSGDDGKVLLEQIMAEYGGNLYHHLRIGEHKATKDAWKLWWNKQEARHLITVLLPHLKLKQHQAQEVLNYLTREIDGTTTV